MFGGHVALVRDEVRRVGRNFRRGQLAQFALTGKVERQVQDQLFTRLGERCTRQGGQLVAVKEWERHDIALLDARTDDPRVIIEMKSYVSVIDVTKGQAYFEADLIRDIGKANERKKNLGVRNCRVLFLALAAHPERLPRDLPKGAVKYETALRNSFARLGGPARARRAMDGLMEPRLGGAKRVGRGRIDAGRCEGARYSVLYWLYRA